MSSRKGAHKISKAVVVSMAPDVCKTPKGGPPVPYNIIAKLHLSENVSPNVNFISCPAFTIISNTKKVWGDEPGIGKGVKSFTVGEKAEPITKSSTVRINGNWVVRHDDAFHMNNKNTMGKLVYTGSSPVSKSSGVGLSAGSVSSDSLSLFSSSGLVGKLTDIGKQMAMTAIMGGDPMATLKAMTDPKGLVKNYLQQALGGLIGDAGPIGSLLGGQVLSGNALDDIVNGRNPMQSLKDSLSPENILKVQAGGLLQNAGPLGSSVGNFALNNLNLGGNKGKSQKPEKNPLASAPLTSSLLNQAGINAGELGSLLRDGASSPFAPKLDNMNFADAYADTVTNDLANNANAGNLLSGANESSSAAPSFGKRNTNEALADSHNLLSSMGRGYENLIKQPSMPSPIDWRALLK